MSKSKVPELRVTPFNETKLKPAPPQTDEQKRHYQRLCDIVLDPGIHVARDEIAALVARIDPFYVGHLAETLRNAGRFLEQVAEANETRQRLGVPLPQLPVAKPPAERMETRWKKRAEIEPGSPATRPLTGEAAKGSYECPCCNRVITILFHDFKLSDSVLCDGCDHKHVLPAEDFLS